MTESVTLNELIGMNVARLRTQYGLTLEAVATAARSYGLRWNVTRVRELEAGKLGVPIQNLLVLGQVFYDLAGHRHQLVDFFEGSRRVLLTPDFEVPTSLVYDAMGGQAVVLERRTPKTAPASLPPLPEGPDTEELARERVAIRAWESDDYTQGLVAGRIIKRMGLTDQRAAKQLGQSTSEWAHWCAALWRRSLRDERDARLDNRIGANPQKTGHVTRVLMDEMADFITRHGGHLDG